MNALRTGELAAQARVNIETLRFYEREGLMPVPPRSGGGYRQYPPDAVDRVLFIKRAQELGFSLKEIRELLQIGARPGATCGEIKSRAEDKIAQIDMKISDLRSMRRALKQLSSICPTDGPTQECPILNVARSQRRRPRPAGENKKKGKK